MTPAKTSQSDGEAAAELRRQMQGLEAEIEKLKAATIESESKLQERFREIASLTILLRQQEEECAAEAAKVDWLRQVALTLFGLRPLFGAARSRNRARRILRAKGLFDDAAYLKRYPDVAATGADPFRHYLTNGIDEGRSRAGGTDER